MNNDLIKHGLPAFKNESRWHDVSLYNIASLCEGAANFWDLKDTTIKREFLNREIAQLTFLMMLVIKMGRTNNNAIVIGSFPVCFN